MDFAANNLGFVIGSYGLSLVVLAALVVWVIVRDRTLRAAADAAEMKKRP